MQENNKPLEKQCSQCKKTFLISTHFQSSRRPEGTKMCLKCRKLAIKYTNKPTSAGQKRRDIYFSHKKKEIEKSRGCQWPTGCRFNFSDQLETFIVCDEVENISIFEFDHVKEKLFKMSQWDNYHTKYNEQDLVDEIAKCRILCAFHHRIHSQNQRSEKKKNKSDYSDNEHALYRRKKKRKNKEKLQKLKLDFGKCLLCQNPVLEGETAGFDFDHIDRLQKHRTISEMVHSGYSWEHSIFPEIEKCRLLCAICHVIHTQEQNMQTRNENVAIVCRKRKRYHLPLNRNKKKLEIHENGERPTKEELHKLVKRRTFVDVGKMYGVEPSTIIYWCKKQGIPHKRIKLMEESE